jgi:hypothetical protein
MARPKKTEGVELEKRVGFRLSAADYEAFMAKVAESGLPCSEFMRKAVLENRTEIVVLAPETRDLVFQFAKIGNNLNQLAKRIHEDHAGGRLDQARYDWLNVRLVAIANYLKALVPK